MASLQQHRTEEESTAENWSSNYRILKEYYKEAFKFINEGLNLEDQGKTEVASTCYKKGLRSCEAAISLPCRSANLSPSEAQEYNKLINKLTKASEEVKLRLVSFGENIPNAEPKEDQCLPSSNSTVDTLPDQSEIISTTVEEMTIENKENAANDTWQDVKELLNISEGVNLFHVDNKGSVGTWMTPCAVQVFQLLKDNAAKISPTAFLKCGDWMFPMEPGHSPVLRTKKRTYMFPDLTTEQTSDASQLPCVGIVLSDFVPDALVNRFERVLKCYCNFCHATPTRPPPPKAITASTTSTSSKITAPTTVSTSSAIVQSECEEIIAESGISNEVEVKSNWTEKISSGIHVGSQWVSWGFVKGAEYASALVEKGAHSLRERIQPNAQSTSVDPELTRNMRQLHQATGSVVQISAFLVSALGAMTISLGRKLAPHIEYHGQKLLPEKYHIEYNDVNQRKLENVKKVAAAGLQGFGLIFLALEQAGKTLYQSVSMATVQTLQHKYGHEVGDVTQDAMGAAGNTVQAYWNVKKLGAKAIAKKAVKDTGRAMITETDSQKPP